MKKLMLAIFMALLSSGCSVFGIGSEEQPKYQVIVKEENKEIRHYQSFIVAKTTVNGSFKEAQSKGFKILAGYIFGKNKSKQKISMTSPVVQNNQEANEKISMTAPVTMASENDQWTMTFSMPSQYTLESLPIPEDSSIKLERVEGRYVAALTFSGFWSEKRNNEEGSKLKEWLEKHSSYKQISGAKFAGYNPPWTIPFLRRNEVLIELQQ
ncbi:MAG: heme-binding protein [Bacteriovoracaceae bacterium]|nr:heme-binding protein [Bacteriovoracaceae bacterium]